MWCVRALLRMSKCCNLKQAWVNVHHDSLKVTRCPCSVLNVKSGEKQARVNGESNPDNVISVQCSECQSGEKTGAGKRQEPNVSTFVDVAVWLECTMNRVSDGDRSTSSFLSCDALQSDEIIGILKVLFWYLGIGHAVGDVAASSGWRRGSSSSWCPTRSLLRRGRASFCDICQHTSSRSLFAGRWPVSSVASSKKASKAEHVPFASVSARCNEVPML